LKYDYELESKNPNCTEYIHKNRKWSIQVAVFSTEIAFSVPYWDDAENAIFEALQTAHELADNGDIVVYDPQSGECGNSVLNASGCSELGGSAFFPSPSRERYF
jgi:hypothetical protein